MDSYVGRMMTALKELGIDQNTLVIFTSDNGPHNESNHDLVRFNPSGPLTGIKRSLTDGGIRVPMIAWWPGRIPTHVVSDHVAYFGVWMATAAELAHAKIPSGCDSFSFVPTLVGDSPKQAKHAFLYWEFHEQGFKQAAIYQGRWKGIRSGAPDAPILLYDQENDAGETTNIANEHPDIASKIGDYLSSVRTESVDWTPVWTVINEYQFRQFSLIIIKRIRHFSLNATIWFPGSAWEPIELQALPASASWQPKIREAEPRRQCVPRQEPGNERSTLAYASPH